MRVPVNIAGSASHSLAGEFDLEVLISRELDGNVSQTQECRGEAGVEGQDALGGVHLARRIKSRAIVPGGMEGGPRGRCV